MTFASRVCARVVQSCALVVLTATGAQAAGVEDTVIGTVALGRSANYVRANDMMAIWQNPANLAVVPGRELALEVRLPLLHACFERERNPAVQYLPTEADPFPKVCNDAAPLPAGSLGYSMPLPRGFGAGIGVFSPGGVPELAFGHGRFNSLSVMQETEPLPITSGVSESPGRFILLDRTVLAAFLMAGVGYQPNRYVRVGASIGLGVIDVKFANMTSLVGGELTDVQVRTDVEVRDSFVPRATASVVVTPIAALDLLAAFTWTDDISAEGTLDVTANGFETAARRNCAETSPGPHCRVDDVTLEIPYQRFELVLGARYAQRRVRDGAPQRALEPMRDEIWDVELNGFWSQTSHVDAYTLRIHEGGPGSPAERRVALSSVPGIEARPLPRQASLFHGWRDTYGLRLGGDYNVLPSLLAVRAGIAWESSGVPAKNMNLDYWPVQKVVLSAGATVAFGRWKVSVAYAHLFNETVEVGVGKGNLREVVAYFPENAQAVNEGTFSSSADVLSLQGNVTF